MCRDHDWKCKRITDVRNQNSRQGQLSTYNSCAENREDQWYISILSSSEFNVFRSGAAAVFSIFFFFCRSPSHTLPVCCPFIFTDSAQTKFQGPQSGTARKNVLLSWIHANTFSDGLLSLLFLPCPSRSWTSYEAFFSLLSSTGMALQFKLSTEQSGPLHLLLVFGRELFMCSMALTGHMRCVCFWKIWDSQSFRRVEERGHKLSNRVYILKV